MKKLLMVLVAATLALSITGCKKETTEDKAKDAIEGAADAVKDAADKVAEKAE